MLGLAANSTATITANSITFNVAPVDNMSVFDITASQLETPNASINFDFNGAQGPLTGIIINVTGATSFNELSSMNFNPTTYEDEHVIWNFDGFTSLSFYQWGGAILAGDATVSNQNALNGFLYAENLTGNGELHDYPLLGVPEPSTWAMLACRLRRPRVRRSLHGSPGSPPSPERDGTTSKMETAPSGSFL